MTAYRTVDVDGIEVFYREAGEQAAPTLLLLHGFPTSSTQYQELIDRLQNRFHLLAPTTPASAIPTRSRARRHSTGSPTSSTGSSAPSTSITTGYTCSTSARPSDSA